MLKFILFVHYRVRNASTLNSLGYETPRVRNAGYEKVMKRMAPDGMIHLHTQTQTIAIYCILKCCQHHLRV